MLKTAVLVGALAFGSLAWGQAIDSTFTTVTVWKFTFSYKIVDKDLVAVVACPTNGWLAVGFNPTSAMKDANIIIGRTEGEYSVVVDEFGTGKFSHQPDTALGGRNDLTATSCLRADGNTQVAFSLPLDSGDPKDRKIVRGAKTRVIFACGDKNDFGIKHVKTAKTEIVF